MILVIFGSRSCNPSVAEIDAALEQMGLNPSNIRLAISGTAGGADRAGEVWAASHGILVRREPADWNRLGKSAGNLRNAKMAQLATHGLGFWDGVSGGTANMVAHMTIRNKPVRLVRG